MRTFDTYECYTQYASGRQVVRSKLDDVGSPRKPLPFRAGASYDPETHTVSAPVEEAREGDEASEGVGPEAAGIGETGRVVDSGDRVAIEYRSISR